MKKVMIGMSGGVDSSVAAALLKDAGYEVVGVTFRLWTPQDDIFDREDSCCSLDDINDARFVCDDLGIAHYVFNFKDIFKDEVVEDFVREYQLGRTPNPCVVCNRKIKFDHFYNKAMSMGFDYIATGHYVRNEWNAEKNRFELKTALYGQKDQSYFLYSIPYSHLAHTLFPLGEYTKPQVRELAEKYGFSVSTKKDSQEICFVDSNGYGTFLEAYTFSSAPKGNFIDKDGNALGQHKGIWHYTIGQRKGLGISLGKPMYVNAINTQDNTVTLVEEKDNYSTEFTISQVNYILPEAMNEPREVLVKIRNRAAFAKAMFTPAGEDKAKIEFLQPEKAVTKGQSAVFYDEDVVLGGGVID